MTSFRPLVVIKGAGDLASGVAYRLFRSGFRIIMTEIAQPLVVRRSVSFAQVVYSGTINVEGIIGVLASSPEQALDLLGKGIIPVLVDDEAKIINRVNPTIVIDAIMAKRNLHTWISNAPLVIGLGPGFTAGMDVHAVVETKRGHCLGRVIYEGGAIPNTGIPGEVLGYTSQRLLKAPVTGVIRACYKIGDQVNGGEIVAYVDSVPVKAEITGVIRGILQDGIRVKAGLKLGDIDPRRETDCFSISDKALAVGGGVMEAVSSYLLHSRQQQKTRAM